MASQRPLQVDPSVLLVERARRGLSQRQLAALCGLGEGTISRIEAGRTSVQARTVYRIAMALGVPVEGLSEAVSTSPALPAVGHVTAVAGGGRAAPRASAFRR